MIENIPASTLIKLGCLLAIVSPILAVLPAEEFITSVLSPESENLLFTFPTLEMSLAGIAMILTGVSKKIGNQHQ